MNSDFRVKYDIDLRTRAAEMFQEGFGYTAVASALNISKYTVRQWWRTYQSAGVGGVSQVGGKQQKYSYETKLAAAKAVVDDGMSKSGAMRKFGIKSYSPLQRWCKDYRNGGAEALRPKPKGRPSGAKTKKKPKTREEELEERIRYLETENAYLKKSIALKAQKNLQTMKKQLS